MRMLVILAPPFCGRSLKVIGRSDGRLDTAHDFALEHEPEDATGRMKLQPEVQKEVRESATVTAVPPVRLAASQTRKRGLFIISPAGTFFW